jgi:hypothetical protein
LFLSQSVKHLSRFAEPGDYVGDFRRVPFVHRSAFKAEHAFNFMRNHPIQAGPCSPFVVIARVRAAG